ncbi:MAG: hypothetical protein ABSF71_05840, partial [Terriglobia bacterium]
SLRRPPNFFQSPNPPNYKPLPSIVLQGLLPALLPYRRIGDAISKIPHGSIAALRSKLFSLL